MVGNITRFKLLSNVTLPIESIHEQPITIAQLYRFFRQNRRLEKVSRKGKSFRHMYELPTCYIAPPGTFVNARTVFHLRPPPTLVKARNTRGYFHVHPRVHASEKDISRSSLRPNEIFEKKKRKKKFFPTRRSADEEVIRSFSREKEETFLNNIRLESLRGGGIKRHTSNEHLLGLGKRGSDSSAMHMSRMHVFPDPISRTRVYLRLRIFPPMERGLGVS